MGLRHMVIRKNEYFPNLDSLRFVSFLLVFISHCFSFLGYQPSNHLVSKCIYYLTLNGDLGVHFFFVLSGFLITIKLLDEKNESGSIDLFEFYKKRILRIWPVYFVVLLGVSASGALMTAITPPGFPLLAQFDRTAFYCYLFFLGNFELIAHGIKNNFITILWSISVEEQFYALSPLLIRLTQLRKLVFVFLGLALMGLGYRFLACEVGDMPFKYSSFSMMYYLVLGCLAAWLTRNSAQITNYFKHASRVHIIILYTFGILLLPLRRLEWDATFINRLLANGIYILEGLFFAYIILEQNLAVHSFYKAGSSRVFSVLGKRTYAMYAYHLIAFLASLVIAKSLGIGGVPSSLSDFLFTASLALLITLGAAEISYRTLEKWFLSLRG